VTSFKSFDGEVPSFYFGSLSSLAHKPFLQSASKPLSAVSARSAVCFCSQYCSWARSHRGRHYDCASYTVFARFWCATTQHVQPKPSSDFALRHWLPK